MNKKVKNASKSRGGDLMGTHSNNRKLKKILSGKLGSLGTIKSKNVSATRTNDEKLKQMAANGSKSELSDMTQATRIHPLAATSDFSRIDGRKKTDRSSLFATTHRKHGVPNSPQSLMQHSRDFTKFAINGPSLNMTMVSGNSIKNFKKNHSKKMSADFGFEKHMSGSKQRAMGGLNDNGGFGIDFKTQNGLSASHFATLTKPRERSTRA